MPAINGLLYGVQPVVIAIVVEAVIRIGRRTLNHAVLVAFAVLAFVALYFFSVPFPLVILAAAIGGLLLSRPVPDAFGEAAGTAPRRRKSQPWIGPARTAGLHAAQPEAVGYLPGTVGCAGGGHLDLARRGRRAGS